MLIINNLTLLWGVNFLTHSPVFSSIVVNGAFMQCFVLHYRTVISVIFRYYTVNMHDVVTG